MSKRGLILGLAIVAVVAGGGIIGYTVLRNTPVGQSVAGAVGLGPKAYTEVDAKAALLTLSDLPGYSISTDDDTDKAASGLSPCGATYAPREITSDKTRNEFSVTKGALGPNLLQSTGLITTGNSLDPLRNAFSKCRKWTEPNGQKITVADANYGNYGDETYSIKMTVTSNSLTVGAALVVIRKANLASLLVMVGFPDVNGDEVVAIAQKAAAKLPA